MLPALALMSIACMGEVDHAQRERNARSYAAPLGEIKALSCQHSGRRGSTMMSTSCTIILEDVGILILNCSNKGCKVIGSHYG